MSGGRDHRRHALLLNVLRRQGRVVTEDRQLDCSEVGARLEAQLVDEAVARLPEYLERLDLAAGAVESDHMKARAAAHDEGSGR